MKSSKDLDGFVLGNGAVIAPFHRSGTSPSVMEDVAREWQARGRIIVVILAGYRQGREIYILLSFLDADTLCIHLQLAGKGACVCK